jgi:hypothetical protein
VASISLARGQLFLEEVFGFANFPANFAFASFNPSLGFHSAIADKSSALFLQSTFDLSRASARPVSCARFHNTGTCVKKPHGAMG